MNKAGFILLSLLLAAAPMAFAQGVAAQAGLTAPNVSGPERDKQYIIETIGNGAFTDISLLSGTAVNEDGREQAGMGVAAGDYDHDGLIDMVKTNFADATTPASQQAGNQSRRH